MARRAMRLWPARYQPPPIDREAREAEEWRIYQAVGGVTGGISFLVAWGYAVVTFGVFLGVGLGWFPALIIGIVAAYAWPFAIIGAVALLVR